MVLVVAFCSHLCTRARSWREFAKSRFTHFPSILSVHVDSYESASFELHMCIKKIPMCFHVVIIGASSDGQVSSQINVAFPLSRSTLRVRCNACGNGFRDSVKVKATMQLNTFTTETTSDHHVIWALRGQ